MPINSFLYPGPTNSNPYVIDNSCRFNDGDSAYLERNFSTTQDSRRTFTVSAWVKRGVLGGSVNIWGSSEGSGEGYNSLKFESDDLQFLSGNTTNSGTQVNLLTDAKYKDPTAWLHVVLAVDSTDATEANRIKIYVNGTQVTSFSTSTYPSQNTDILTSTTPQMTIGMRDLRGTNAQFFDGYISEFCFIDGSALTPSSFGEFDSDSPNIWKPKAIALTFGTNGYYLEFKQTGTSANSSGIGADTSGSDYHFSVTNLAATDQASDSPTNNFATWNPLMKPSSASTFSEGNLKVTNGTNSVYPYSVSTQGFSQGKWYAEFKYTPTGDGGQVGIMDLEIATTNFQANNVGSSSDGCITYQYNGNIIGDGTAHSTGNTSLSNGDIVGVAVDEDNQEIYFYVNGTLQNSGGTDYSNDAFTSGFVGFYCGDASGGGTDTWEANFGSPFYAISSGNADANGYGNFEYAVPSGYYALCTKNLAEYG